VAVKLRRRNVDNKLPLERSLLFRKLDNLPLDKHSLSLSHIIHVNLGNVCPIRLFTEIFQLLHRSGNPERVQVEGLVAREDELRRGSARSPLSDFWNLGHVRTEVSGREG
jgi:hypothetical protein